MGAVRETKRYDNGAESRTPARGHLGECGAEVYGAAKYGSEWVYPWVEGAGVKLCVCLFGPTPRARQQ